MKDMLTSKKFIVMIAGVLLAIASKAGLHLDPDLLNQILALSATFIVGQGIADHGKEAAKIASGSVPAVTIKYGGVASDPTATETAAKT